MCIDIVFAIQCTATIEHVFTKSDGQSFAKSNPKSHALTILLLENNQDAVGA